MELDDKARLYFVKLWVVYGYGQSRICRGAMRSNRKSYRAHAWPEVTSPEVTWLSPRPFFPVLFSPYFFSVLFFPYYFPVLFFPVLFFRILFFRAFFRTFFSHTFFFVLFSRTFEIERFKISVSCFSSTCRYITVHVPCGIAIQTSPVRLPLDGWGARMRDLKGPNINLFNLKEDSNVL
jgi:hypothetical protein